MVGKKRYVFEKDNTLLLVVLERAYLYGPFGAVRRAGFETPDPSDFGCTTSLGS